MSDRSLPCRNYLQSVEGLWDIDQMEDDWLVLAEHLTTGNSEDQRVANLASSTGDSDSNWWFLFWISKSD